MPRCEECWAVLDPAKALRCVKCKACFYCSKACQTRNWRIHKRVCTTDHLLRPFIRVEMAVERALKRPKIQQAPKDARCYICLEGEDDGRKSSKLMRGCACRGDSAGFVHVDCLTEFAKCKEASGDPGAVFNCWLKCGNCKQDLQGVLHLEMRRRFWRRWRSSQDQDLDYQSMVCLATGLGFNGEMDAANQLLDDASNCVGNNTEVLLDLQLTRAELLHKVGALRESLGLLQATLPEVKAYTDAHPQLYGHLMLTLATVFLDLDRVQEGHEAAAEALAFNKVKFGLEHALTLSAKTLYAVTCAKLRRVEEAKVNFETVLTIQTRVFGRDHPHTQATREYMQFSGFAEPSV